MKIAGTAFGFNIILSGKVFLWINKYEHLNVNGKICETFYKKSLILDKINFTRKMKENKNTFISLSKQFYPF